MTETPVPAGPPPIAYHPDPPRFGIQAYRVNLSWVGDEGTMVALGHIAPLRFLAACNQAARNAGMRNVLDDVTATLEDAREHVRHAWAVRLPKCPGGHEVCCPCCVDHDPSPDPGDWFIKYMSDITADTPGAFPITLGEWWE